MSFAEKMRLGPHKEKITLKKWSDAQNPEIDEPEEVIIREAWYDQDNKQIFDAETIALLEEKYGSIGGNTCLS